MKSGNINNPMLSATELVPPPAKLPSGKLVKAAHDFEAILLTQWLEHAESSFATVPGSDSDQDRDVGSDQFRSLAMQHVAKHLADTGGIGIAAMLLRHAHTPQSQVSSPDQSKAPLPEGQS